MLEIGSTLYYYYIEEKSSKISMVECKIELIDKEEDDNLLYFKGNNTMFMCYETQLNKVMGECFTTSFQREIEEIKIIFDIGLQEQEFALDEYRKKEVKRIRKLRERVVKS